MSYYPMTQAQLQTAVFQMFPRSNSEVITMFNNSLESWVNELCDFPYWFLTISPNADFTLGFPYTTLPTSYKAGYWIDRGWLITQPGVNKYKIYAPLENDQSADSSWWAPAKVRQVGFIKEYTEQGQFRYDLEISAQNNILSNMSFLTQNNLSPKKVWIEQTESGSYLTFHPVPSEKKVYAIQFVLQTCPFYQSVTDSAIHNRWLTYAPQAVLYKCLIHVARYFDEKNLLQEYQTALYGDPPKGEVRSQFPYKGILGKLWEDTREMAKQIEQSIPWYKSSAQAFGRGGILRQSHWMGSGYFRFWP